MQFGWDLVSKIGVRLGSCYETDDFVVIAVEKADAEEQLAEALPALERARKALENLNKEDVTEIRQFANPPQAVQYVCACVAFLKGYKQADWKTCRGMMSDTNFLTSLQNLEVDNIKDKEVKEATKITTILDKEGITQEAMESKSKAGAGLYTFACAVLGYCDVAKKIKPKREKVAKLEHDYQVSKRDLDKINKELNAVTKMLAELSKK